MPDPAHPTSPGPGDDAPLGPLLSAIPAPAALLDASGLVTHTNAAWASHHGPHALLVGPGQSLVDALAALPQGAPAAKELRELLAGQRLDFTCEAGPPGSTRLLASRGRGQSTLVLIVETAYPRGEPDAQRDDRLQRIIESAMDGIVTVNESQNIIMFNAAAERMFGVSAAEAMGGPLDRFLPQRHRASHAEYIRGFGETGVSSRAMGNLGTVHGVRADGTEFPIEASISHATVGTRRFFTVILRDVSERRRLEAQLLQSQKMEGVGRLAGGIAHDFNNLLMAIFNYHALASRKLGPDHPVAPSLAQAQLAAERAADLTRQLLTFARQRAVVQRVLCPREVVTGLSPMLHRLIDDDVTLRTVLSDDTGNVRADPAQLEQVLVNLTINARDAMPDGGTVTIETRNETLDQEYCRSVLDATPGEYVVISVTDTGTGMTPEVRARLFEPFFTTKPVGKGTGLGLATCHGIVKQSGGHIAVHTEPGRGTTLRVCLPRVPAQATAHPDTATSPPAPRGSETILLVEDSALVRELVTEGLSDAGYKVISAASGAEALRIVDAGDTPIDLLLTDIVMPEMNGVQLAKAVLQRRPVKVIFMSGYTEETVSQHGVDSQIMEFIAKPFLADTLLRLIHRVLHPHKSA